MDAVFYIIITLGAVQFLLPATSDKILSALHRRINKVDPKPLSTAARRVLGAILLIAGGLLRMQGII